MPTIRVKNRSSDKMPSVLQKIIVLQMTLILTAITKWHSKTDPQSSFLPVFREDFLYSWEYQHGLVGSFLKSFLEAASSSCQWTPKSFKRTSCSVETGDSPSWKNTFFKRPSSAENTFPLWLSQSVVICPPILGVLRDEISTSQNDFCSGSLQPIWQPYPVFHWTSG